jgi:kynureninase
MLRSRYFLPDNAIELRAFTHGLMPRTVPAMMDHFLADWRERGVDSWNEVPNHWLPDSGEAVGWWNLPEYLGDRFVAPLLGAPEGTCILIPNAQWAMQCVLSSPEVFHGGGEVVFTDAEFPSVQHSVRHWAAMLGFTAVSVPPGADGFVSRERLLEAISDETALVIVSHVGFLTGERLDDDFLVRLREKAHCHGALLAIDGYHASSSLHIDVTRLGVDVYFGGLLKEASGSSGNGFVYVRPGLALTPRIGGWVGDADPFAFAPSPQAHDVVRRRFLGGTPAIAPLYHAIEGVRGLLEAGLDRVERDVLEKTSRCIEHAEALGLTLRSPADADRRGAMVIFDVEGADRLSLHLRSAGILTDSRLGRYLRMAPFVWNTHEEIDRTFEVLAGAVVSGSYRSSASGARGPVT